MGRGRSKSPSPPPAKTYTQAEVDQLQKEWQTTADAGYDTRLAGQKDIWSAEEEARKLAYIGEQRDLYDQRLVDAKGEWRTAADARYDARLGEARQGWHDIAEQQYGTRLDTAKTNWQTEADKISAATQEEFNKKYGTLQGQYDNQLTDYESLQDKYGQLDKQYLENENRYGVLQSDHGDLQSRYGDLEGKYGTQTEDYGALQGKYGDLESTYETTDRDLNRLQTDVRRDNFGSSEYVPESRTETPSYDDGGVSSEDRRLALLTGDYSYLATDREKNKGGTDDSWKKYLQGLG